MNAKDFAATLDHSPLPLYAALRRLARVTPPEISPAVLAGGWYPWDATASTERPKVS
jgi:hypothetical protein